MRIKRSTFKPMRKQMTDDVSISEGERAVTAAISTITVDRDGEVLLPSGADISDFEKSPTVFYNHDYTLPVGRATGFKRTDETVLAKTVFAARPDDHVGEWLPDTLLSLFRQKVIHGFSVGFLPIEGRPPSKQDQLRFGDDVRYIYSKWRMLEFSVAPLPSNQDALAVAVGKGLLTKVMAATLCPGVEIPDAPSSKKTLVVELPIIRATPPKPLRSVQIEVPRIYSPEQKAAMRAKAREQAELREVAKAQGLIYL